MEIMYAQPGNCLVQLAGSLLAWFDLPAPNGTLPLCDELLSRRPWKNAVVLLLDGMGQSILQSHLEPDGLFRSHLAGVYSSVFPPTTVAATTALNSGLYPSQHGWLGWDCYFPWLDQNVTVFRNTLTGTDTPAAPYPVAQTYLPYDSLISRIRAGGGQAEYASPFQAPNPPDLPAVLERVRELCAAPGKKYIYAYWKEPDSTLHAKGCYGEDARRILRDLEAQVGNLLPDLQDTLLLVTADHGHMDSRGAALEDYPEILECLTRMPSIEPRAVNLFVRAERKAQFEAAFSRAFSQDFLLLSHAQVMEQSLFGPGPVHPALDAMVGDYVAVAIGDLSLYDTREEASHFIGVHAGLTREEMQIPLIALET